MALRIEKAFGPDMDHLLRMQLAYDLAKTRRQSYGGGAFIATKTDTMVLETALIGLEAESRTPKDRECDRTDSAAARGAAG